MRYTMITRIGYSEDKVISYILIDENYNTQVLSADALISGIKSKKLNVTNVGYENNKIVGTNGAISKYTLVKPDSMGLDGFITSPKAVILNRVEKNGKLVGYTIFTQTGRLAEVDTKKAAELASKKLIANGKIRTTQNGDIVASINGNYPLREIKIEDVKTTKNTMKVTPLLGGILKTEKGSNAIPYMCLIVKDSNSVAMSKTKKALRELNNAFIEKLNKNGLDDMTESFSNLSLQMINEYAVIEFKHGIEILKKASDIEFKQMIFAVEKNGEENTFTIDKDGKVVNAESLMSVLNDSEKAVLGKMIAEIKEVVSL